MIVFSPWGLAPPGSLSGTAIQNSRVRPAEKGGKTVDGQPNKALEYAARLLAPRAMSERTLRGKLESKGFEAADIDDAMRRLTEMGGLNDREYAGMVARHYVNRGFGRQKVAQELRRRGVGKDIADEILPDLAPCSRQVEAYLEKTIRGQIEDKRVLRRAAAGLYRRGFSWEQINAAIDVYCNPACWDEEQTAEEEE